MSWRVQNSLGGSRTVLEWSGWSRSVENGLEVPRIWKGPGWSGIDSLEGS